MRHLREPRVWVLVALMLGTVPTTIFSFSNGHLSLPRNVEEFITTAGIALAFEVGAVLLGWRIEQVTARIPATRNRERRDALLRTRKQLYVSFGGVALASFVAGMIYRVPTTGNFWLAAFVSATPAALIVIFTVVLAPLPPDHQGEAAEAAQLAVTELIVTARGGLVAGIGRIARGEVLREDELRMLQFVGGLILPFAGREEAQMLDHAAQFAAPPSIEAAAVEWWTARDVVDAFDVSLRTAQNWIRECPGSRLRAGTAAREAPREAIERAHPPLLRLAVPRSRDEESVQANEAAMQLDAREVQVSA